MGTNGFGNFWAGHTTGAGLGNQWEPMDLVTFGLGIHWGRAGEPMGTNGMQPIGDNFEGGHTSTNSISWQEPF